MWRGAVAFGRLRLLADAPECRGKSGYRQDQRGPGDVAAFVLITAAWDEAAS
jgi:hypothetical protein